MFGRLRRRLRPHRKSAREEAEDETACRRAQRELHEAELRAAEERQRLESGGGRPAPAPPGGMSAWG